MVHFIHQMQYYITFEVSPLAALLRLQAVKQQFKTLVITARKGGGAFCCVGEIQHALLWFTGSTGAPEVCEVNSILEGCWFKSKPGKVKLMELVFFFLDETAVLYCRCSCWVKSVTQRFLCSDSWWNNDKNYKKNISTVGWEAPPCYQTRAAATVLYLIFHKRTM